MSLGEKSYTSPGDDNNKLDAKNIEEMPSPGSPERILAERNLVRKLDTHLLPTIFLIFIMNYIDVGFFSVFGKVLMNNM